jgi:sugar lactone lactonase YvrE
MKAILVPLCLLLSGPLMANPVLKTVAGGPTQFNPRYYGYADGVTATMAQFDYPCGLALDPSGTSLFIADCTNNALRVISSLDNISASFTSTFAGLTNGIDRPVAVAVDGATNVYVLNRGSGTNGTLLQFNGSYYSAYGVAFLVATNASGLVNPTALALDALTNLYVTLNSNTVLRITPAGLSSIVGVISNPGVALHGITVLDNGLLALTDAGNNGIWMLNPATGAASQFTGFHGPGDVIGPPGIAAFNYPEMIAQAAGNLLIVADRGNHKVKTVDSLGQVTRLYGVSSNYWVQGSASAGIYPGWEDGTVCSVDELGCPEAREPLGVAVASDGSVYTTEVYYHLVRHTTATGFTGPVRGSLPLFNGLTGIAFDASFTRMFIADTANNAVEVLDLNLNQTTNFLQAAQGLAQPVDVIVDALENLYVLNRGSGGNGSILQFDPFGNLLATNAAGLASPSAFALDSSGNFYVACQGGTIQRFGSGQAKTVATVTATNGAGVQLQVQLQGIALFDDGAIAVSDAANHVLWQVDPVTGAPSLLTGALGVPGSTLGGPAFARLNQPQRLARALGDLLVVADGGNNRLVVADRSGSVTNVLVSTNSLVWYGRASDPHGPGDPLFVPMLSPVGVALDNNGGVFDSEPASDALRELLATGLAIPSPGGVTGTGTNAVVLAPVIDPASDSGYYPMGRSIAISSTSSNVFYTTDGTEPTTNSAQVAMSAMTGVIHWFNPSNDVTALQVKAFVGTNSSVTVSGQPSATNTIGIPSRSPGGFIPAGIGSTIVLPMVVNLQPGVQVESYQFRVEISPNDAASPPITNGFQTLPVSGNDFVPLVTAAQGNVTLNLPGQPYFTGPTSGLAISTANNGGVLFQRFAVVTMLAVKIPSSAISGNSYSLSVTNPSATSDGLSAAVNLTPFPPVTILVTNIPYTVGNSASPAGAWYNAGEFGDTNLDNADVNNAFCAALGLHVPYTFSDVFNAMDAYPPDADGFVGGDGQIRFLDWQTILRRSLRLDTNDWDRAWSLGGVLTNFTVSLLPGSLLRVPQPQPKVIAPWYRQALVGAVSLGQAVPGALVTVPVYVEMTDGATLSGLQFRALVTPCNGAPPPAQAPQFIADAGLPAPSLQQGFQPNEMAFGWSLGSFNFLPLSSNFLGLVAFTIPPAALPGQVYSLSFTNADGAPDIQTQYDLETRSASVTVGAPATLASICSDDWKLHFFGSLTDPRAADTADPDGDGMPNWMEFLAGTSPIDFNSKLQFSSAEKSVVNGQAQTVVNWLTAPGRAYQVLWSAQPSGGAWSVLATVSGNGAVAACADTNAPAGSRYYRLRVLP